MPVALSAEEVARERMRKAKQKQEEMEMQIQAGNSIEEILRRVGQRVGADVSEPISILQENFVHTTEAFDGMTD